MLVSRAVMATTEVFKYGALHTWMLAGLATWANLGCYGAWYSIGAK